MSRIIIDSILSLTSALMLLCSAVSCGTTENGLKKSLEELVSEFPGDVGIAVVNDTDTVCINGDAKFPMFSVVKFHQALAVCETVRASHFFQPYLISVGPDDLKPDTWSPMREEYPEGGEFTLKQILEYSLVESDNNACDILFKTYASPSQVEEYINSIGIVDCGIVWNEDDQHADVSRCYENWTTPLAAAELLGYFYDNRDKDDYSRLVWGTMAKCQTGTNRIPKYIADNTSLIIHKTGTGGMSSDGKVMGINDIACILLPDGSHFELAVFIKDASCQPADCEELIAQIAKACIEVELLKKDNN